MNWTPITGMHDLDTVDKASYETVQLLFKHSTKCNISSDAYSELEKGTRDIGYIDLWSYRNIADEVSARYGILHQSPQILIIKDGKAVYHESHWRIKNETIEKVIAALNNE